MPRKTTERMKYAIRFIEDTIGLAFEGDIENGDEVSKFLGRHLEFAKWVAEYRLMDREYWLYKD